MQKVFKQKRALKINISWWQDFGPLFLNLELDAQQLLKEESLQYIGIFQ